MSGTRPGRTLLRQEVVEGIKRYILDERLRPGDPLPTGRRCARRWGPAAPASGRPSRSSPLSTSSRCATATVRTSAALSLSALVESLTFRGLLSPDDDFQVMADLVDVRELFERGMADRIISSLSTEQLDGLERLVETMRATGAGEGDGFVAADRAFHALLVAPLGNDLIGQLSMAFWDVYTIVAPHLDGFTHADETATIAAHQNIVDAARAGDVTAFLKALDEHYAPVRRRIAEARSRVADPAGPA